MAVSRFPDAIQYIRNPHPDVQLLAVKENGPLIRHINNPTSEVQLAAIEYSEWTLELIDNPTLECCMLAVSMEPSLMAYVPKEYLQEVLLVAKI